MSQEFCAAEGPGFVTGEGQTALFRLPSFIPLAGGNFEAAPLPFSIPDPSFDMRPVAWSYVLLDLFKERGEVAQTGDGRPASIVDQRNVLP